LLPPPCSKEDYDDSTPSAVGKSGGVGDEPAHQAVLPSRTDGWVQKADDKTETKRCEEEGMNWENSDTSEVLKGPYFGKKTEKRRTLVRVTRKEEGKNNKGGGSFQVNTNETE